MHSLHIHLFGVLIDKWQVLEDLCTAQWNPLQTRVSSSDLQWSSLSSVVTCSTFNDPRPSPETPVWHTAGDPGQSSAHFNFFNLFLTLAGMSLVHGLLLRPDNKPWEQQFEKTGLVPLNDRASFQSPIHSWGVDTFLLIACSSQGRISPWAYTSKTHLFL